jgi:hypothetical protein
MKLRLERDMLIEIISQGSAGRFPAAEWNSAFGAFEETGIVGADPDRCRLENPERP